MQTKQATGLDTRMLTPVYAGVFTIICQLFMPWITIPMLKRCKLPGKYSIFQTGQLFRNLQDAAENCTRVELEPMTQDVLSGLMKVSTVLAVMSVVLMAVMVWVIASVLIRRTKSKTAVRIGFGLNFLFGAAVCAVGVMVNLLINQQMGRENTFFNLTVHSQAQITSWIFGQMLISVIVFFAAGRLLTLEDQTQPQMYVERSMHEDRRVSRRTWMAIAMILLAIPLVIFFGVYFMGDRGYVFIGLCIVCLAMLPFAMVFEDRKPQARELLLIAVMAGIAVAGRMAFFMLPQFKPATAVVIIAGIGLGAEAGFLTGAVTGFVSNFFFGQGPWTPWQMFAFGIIGFLAGLLFHRSRRLKRMNEYVRLALECIYGGVATLVIYGLIMDLSGVLTMTADGVSWSVLLAKVVSGFPFNMIHAASTVFFLLFLARPMEKKLERIKKKYGILEV